MVRSLRQLEREIAGCRKCPRLRSWCERVAVEKRAMYRTQTYWGRPVAGFGDSRARLLVLGLAPGAHGANRTGRVFTGDRSGDWLFGALHAAGFANQPASVHRNDGLVLKDCWVSASVRCAPPANRPLPSEVDACQPFLLEELKLLANIRLIVALGRLAWENLLGIYRLAPRRDYPFAHLAEIPAPRSKDGGSRPALLASYHPSQQNTQTGRLTREMLDAVFARARLLLGSAP
jgi:uracil-DNA glycosylase family 4